MRMGIYGVRSMFAVHVFEYVSVYTEYICVYVCKVHMRDGCRYWYEQ